jgi:hypothetical protein
MPKSVPPNASGVGNLLAAVRQWRFPAEFRIRAARWPAPLVPFLEALAGAAPVQRPADDTKVAEPPAASPALDDAALAALATGLWRIRNRMLEPGTDRPRDSMKMAFRHLESTEDVLREAGIETQDHTGSNYDLGLSLTVLAFQKTPGLARDTIIETVKPSVYRGKLCIQGGEVIVGVPEDQTRNQPKEDGTTGA